MPPFQLISPSWAIWTRLSTWSIFWGNIWINEINILRFVLLWNDPMKRLIYLFTPSKSTMKISPSGSVKPISSSDIDGRKALPRWRLKKSTNPSDICICGIDTYQSHAVDIFNFSCHILSEKISLPKVDGHRVVFIISQFISSIVTIPSWQSKARFC